MVNIRKIIREEIDKSFDWIQDIEPGIHFDDLNQGVHEYFYNIKRGEWDDENLVNSDGDDLTPKEKEDRKYLVMEFLNTQFTDVEFDNGNFYMYVDDFSEFVDFFKDTSSDYGYIGKDLAELILSEDDHWEPYYDVIYDWENQVWDSLSGDNKKLILTGIIKKFNGEELGDNLVIDGDFERKMVEDDTYFGQLIMDDDVFGDIKIELDNLYKSEYNQVVYSQYYNACIDSITGMFGDYEWSSFKKTVRVNGENKEVTGHNLKFNITDICFDILDKYFNEYCHTRWDCEMEYSHFLDTVRLLVHEEIWDEYLHPRGGEYPDHHKLEQGFNERVSDEIPWFISH